MQNFRFPLAAQAHVLGARDTLKRWQAGLTQAIAEQDEAGIAFCRGAVETAKARLEQAKDEALDLTRW
jgi:hypothetical protein